MVNVTAALVGAKEFYTLIDFLYHVWLGIVVFGLISNVINIIVFLGLDDRDNVSTSLLVLSFSDLGYLIIRCFSTVARFLLVHHETFPWAFDYSILVVCIYWYGLVFYDYSCFISVFLAVVRSCCVVMPLKFKSVFTRSRTVKSLIGLFVAAFCLRSPQIFSHGLSWKTNPATNKSLLTCTITSVGDIQLMSKVNDIMNRNILSWVAYITVVVCVVTMIVKLRSASKFRKSAAQTVLSKGDNDKDVREPDPALNNTVTENTADTSATGPASLASRQKQQKNPEKMSSKETQLIQSVVLLSIIFLLSQLPFQVYSTIRLFVPEFDTFGSQVFLFSIAGHISLTFSLLNCSVNIFVYCTYNRKYKARISALFSLKAK